MSKASPRHQGVLVNVTEGQLELASAAAAEGVIAAS